MHIDTYSFGSMTVDGKTYTADIIVFPDHIQSNWWRREGHSLAMEDLEDVVAVKPDILIVGTGASGIMKISAETRQVLKEKNIKLFDQPTDKAYRLFNSYQNKKEKVTGAFHLTC